MAENLTAAEADAIEMVKTYEAGIALSNLASALAGGDGVMAFNALITAAMLVAKAAPRAEITQGMLLAGMDACAKAHAFYVAVDDPRTTPARAAEVLS